MLTIGCEDTEGGFAEIDPDGRPTHITSAQFADELANGVRPNIDWVTWYREGRSLDLFPLELRTRDEINAELITKGRRLPGGGYGSIRSVTHADRELSNAEMLVIRHLQPSDCPIVPCYMGPGPESQFRATAQRLGLPYTLVPKDQRVLQIRNSDGEIETVRYDEGVGW
ncbi:MAG: hypothetical protein F4187_06055 [Gemmatimonadetes bacterium]|nr:hypothetical protein [Gemmatimonadota bacterium]